MIPKVELGRVLSRIHRNRSRLQHYRRTAELRWIRMIPRVSSAWCRLPITEVRRKYRQLPGSTNLFPQCVWYTTNYTIQYKWAFIKRKLTKSHWRYENACENKNVFGFRPNIDNVHAMLSFGNVTCYRHSMKISCNQFINALICFNLFKAIQNRFTTRI